MRSVGGRRHTVAWWAAYSYKYCSMGPSCVAELRGDEQSSVVLNGGQLIGGELSGEDLRGGELLSYL